MKKLKQSWLNWLFCLIFVSGLMLTGCSDEQATSSPSETNNETTTETPITAQANESQNMDNYTPRLEGNATVEMMIKGSPVIIEVRGDEAPVTAGNFVDLVDKGFYDGLTFHRVVKDPQPFVAQGGDPQGTGTGGYTDPKTNKPRYVPLEIQLKDQDKPIYGKGLGRQAGISEPPVVLNHKRGAVAMARSQAPDSASSQFYFALDQLDFLDGDYAVFGYVTSGMETVDKINQGDRIESAKVTSGLENLKR